MELWKAAVDTKTASGTWYRESGSGMGATLNTAAGMNAYTLTDRGTWLSFKNRGDLEILVEGDTRLFNQYGIMLVNPASIRTSRRTGPDLHRLGAVAGGAEASPTTRWAASSCSSPTRSPDAVRAAIFLAGFVVLANGVHAQEGVQLYAAGSLKGAMTEIADAYTARGGQKVVRTFGPSGV